MDYNLMSIEELKETLKEESVFIQAILNNDKNLTSKETSLEVLKAAKRCNKIHNVIKKIKDK